jgi:hypothetical protein
MVRINAPRRYETRHTPRYGYNEPSPAAVHMKKAARRPLKERHTRRNQSSRELTSRDQTSA